MEDAVFGHSSLLSSPSDDSGLTEAACETSIDQQNNTKSDEAEGSLDANDENTADEATAGVRDLKLTDSGSPNDPNDQHTLSTSDVDLLLDKCLLQALHTTLKDKDLPIPGSTLW